MSLMATQLLAGDNFDKKHIEEQILNQFERLVETAKSLDHESYMKFFDSSKLTSFNDDGTITEDFNAFSIMIEKGFSGFKRYKTLEFNTVKISVIDINTAILMNEYNAVVILKNNEAFPVAGAGTQVWNLSNGQWKIVHVTSNHRQTSEGNPK
jgi:hypothetical protein